jgi:four helix bundle protein
MRAFDHHYLDVYWCAVTMAAEVYRITRGPARKVYPLTDQALRAATSVALNIAEGAGEFTPREKCRFYRIARRSAAETSAALDLLVAMDVLEASNGKGTQGSLREIGAMLTGMIMTQTRRSTDTTDSRRKRGGHSGVKERRSAPRIPPGPSPSPSPSPGPRRP